MERVIIALNSFESPDANCRAALPLHALDIAIALLPATVRNALKNEEIGIGELGSLAGQKYPKGEFLKVETPRCVVTLFLE